MCVGAAQECRLERALGVEVVDVAAEPAQQPLVLDTRHADAEGAHTRSSSRSRCAARAAVTMFA